MMNQPRREYLGGLLINVREPNRDRDDCCKGTPVTAIARLRAETPTNSAGEAETPPNCAGEAETPPDHAGETKYLNDGIGKA